MRSTTASEADARADDLFDLPPEEFTAVRDELVRELRAAGRRDAARQVGRLRRPAVAAWAVNRLVRSRPERLEALSAAADEVADVQRRTLSGLGGGEELRAADRRRREAVGALAEEASAMLADAGRNPDPHRRAIHDTFDAASLDPDARENVRSGRLSKPLEPPSGFGAVAGLRVVPPPPAEPRAAEAGGEASVAAGGEEVEGVDGVDGVDGGTPADAAARRQAEVAARREAEEQARRRRREQAAEQARRAGEAAAAAEAEARAADRTAEDLEQQAERLVRRAAAARRDADGVADRARRARRDAERADEAARRHADA